MYIAFGDGKRYEMPVNGINDFKPDELTVKVRLSGTVESLYDDVKGKEIIRTYQTADGGESVAVYNGYTEFVGIEVDSKMEIATVTLHKPSELEKRVEQLEDSQSAQDMAIDDLGMVLSDIINDSVVEDAVEAGGE